MIILFLLFMSNDLAMHHQSHNLKIYVIILLSEGPQMKKLLLIINDIMELKIIIHFY